MARIFVIEDNDSLRETISSYLTLEDYDVDCFDRLSGVEQAVRMKMPDLLVLDVMLPDGDGFRFARNLRRWSRVPIIFLTARTSESDRITGFETGGDDYVTKPFSNKELMLRVSALLKRSRSDNEPHTSLCPLWNIPSGKKDKAPSVLELDKNAHRCLADQKTVSLTAAEWKILNHLAENSGTVISREQLLGVCLEYQAEGSERTIDTHIKNIRLKLGNQQWIETVRGFGYRFAGERQEK